jgi:ribosomal protein S18 acetylase RimI-like enzyme
MYVSLQPMDPAALPDWLAIMRRGYEEQRVASGESAEAASASASTSLGQLFPAGRPGPGQSVYDVHNGERSIGWLWIGPALTGAPADWWVWSVEVHPEARGRGVGRRAMELAEDRARAGGARSLGLNVFGHNDVARHLYESLGYDTVSVLMHKLLG